MLMDSQVKICSPRNISGASQQNRVAPLSSPHLLDGNLKCEKQKETTKRKT